MKHVYVRSDEGRDVLLGLMPTPALTEGYNCYTGGVSQWTMLVPTPLTTDDYCTEEAVLEPMSTARFEFIYVTDHHIRVVCVDGAHHLCEWGRFASFPEGRKVAQQHARRKR